MRGKNLRIHFSRFLQSLVVPFPQECLLFLQVCLFFLNVFTLLQFNCMQVCFSFCKFGCVYFPQFNAGGSVILISLLQACFISYKCSVL
jgi:hypothetical protein